MSFIKDFWSQDRTTINGKMNWFQTMPPIRKLIYSLMAAFISMWCLYLGVTLANALAPEWEEGSYLDASDLLNTGDDYQEASDLEGMDVILLVGADKRPGETSYRTDTIILAFLDWDHNTLKMLSIPRDSYVQLASTGTRTKINEAYFYGGITLLKQTIEYTFGIMVDNYIEVDFTGFVEIIDAIGGVTVDVSQRMYKPSENINLYAGEQTLNGTDALAFVRFRDMPQGDIDRIANQQIFLKALANELLSASTITKIPNLIKIGLENSNTDLTLAQATSLATAAMKLDLENLEMHSVPGVAMWIGYGSYWIISESQFSSLIQEITHEKMDGVLNIITDGGRGSYSAPSSDDDEDEEEPPDGEGEGLEEDGEGLETDADGEAGMEPPADAAENGLTDGGGTTEPADSGGSDEGAGDVDIDWDSIPEPPSPAEPSEPSSGASGGEAAAAEDA